MTLHDLALLLFCQRMEDRPQLAANIPEDGLPPSLGHETTWYLQSHLEWARVRCQFSLRRRRIERGATSAADGDEELECPLRQYRTAKLKCLKGLRSSLDKGPKRTRRKYSARGTQDL